MERLVIAYVLIVLFVAIGARVVYISIRYLNYQEAIRRGHRDAKPVRKPFWFN